MKTTLFELFFTFFKLGLFTFGGGYAMIANVREIVTEKKRWLSEEELLEVIAISESTPGPIAINMATYVGYRMRGVAGSALATLGVVLPSLIIIYVISLFLEAFMANVYVQYAFFGISCAVAFLIFKAGVTMAKKLPREGLCAVLFVGTLAVLVLCELFSLSLSAIVLIAAGGLISVAVMLAKKRGGKP